MNSSQMTQKDLYALHAEARIDAQNSVVLKYSFQNSSSQDVYLFNRIYKNISAGPVFETDRNLVNIESSPNAVVLSKKIVPVPPDVDVEKPSLPCATLVKPGSKFSESVQIPLPLVEWSPYLLPSEPPSDAPVVHRKAWFELGFFVSSPAAQSLARRVRTKEGEAFYFDPFPVSGQRTLKVQLEEEFPIRMHPRQ